jgi:hypothetical protein
MSDRKISDLGTETFPVPDGGVDPLQPFPNVPANDGGVYSISELQSQLDGSEVYGRIEKASHTA